MKRDINLKSPRQHTAQEERTLKMLYIIAISSLVSVLVLSIVLFIITWQTRPDTLLQQEALVTQSLGGVNDKTVKLVFTKQRVSYIQQIIAQRALLNDHITQLEKQIPQDISLDAVTLNKYTLSLGLSSSSLFALQTFEANLTRAVSEKQFLRNVTFSTFSANPQDSSYQVLLTAQLL